MKIKKIGTKYREKYFCNAMVEQFFTSFVLLNCDLSVLFFAPVAFEAQNFQLSFSKSCLFKMTMNSKYQGHPTTWRAPPELAT